MFKVTKLRMANRKYYRMNGGNDDVGLVCNFGYQKRIKLANPKEDNIYSRVEFCFSDGRG